MIVNLYVIHDKVDNVYNTRQLMAARSEREVCRGYIQMFKADNTVNPAEFELVRIGKFDDEKCILTSETPVVVDVKQVYADRGDTHGEVVDE